MSELRKDAFLESWLRRLLSPARRRARAGPTSTQLNRLRRRVLASVGIEDLHQAAA